MIDTVIFDLGGVLVDWNPDYVFGELFPDPDELRWFYQNVCTSGWNLQQDAGRPLSEATEEKVAEWPRFERQIRSYYGRWEQMLQGSLDDTVDILATLRRREGLRLLALTNWSAETFPVALDRFEFLQWFEGIVVSGHEGVIKPDPEIYEILVQRYRVQREKALFIDDSETNVIAARKAGMQALHYTGTKQLRSDLAALDLIEQ